MKIIQSFVILFCLTFLQQGISQNAFPPAFDIVTDTIGMITLPDSNWQFVEDKSHTWTIDSVRQPSFSNKFRYAIPKVQGYDYPMYNFWVRYRLKNSMNREAKFNLRFFAGRQCDIYFIDQTNSVSYFVSGMFVPWSKRDGIKLNNSSGGDFLPISLLSNQEVTIYIKCYTLSFFSLRSSAISLNIYSNEKKDAFLINEAEASYFTNLSNAFFFGLALIAFAFNFLFYWLSKDKLYFHFSLYVLSIGGIGRFALSLYLLFFKEAPLLFWTIYPIGLSSIGFFFIHYLRHLLKISSNYPILDKYLSILSYFVLIYWFVGYSIIFNLYPVYGNRILHNGFDIFATLLWFSVLITLFLYIRHPEKSVRKIIYGLLPPLGIWIICRTPMWIMSFLNREFNMPYSPFINQIRIHCVLFPQ